MVDEDLPLAADVALEEDRRVCVLVGADCYVVGGGERDALQLVAVIDG